MVVLLQAIKKASDSCLEVVDKEDGDDKSEVSTVEQSELSNATPMDEEVKQIVYFSVCFVVVYNGIVYKSYVQSNSSCVYSTKQHS